MNEVTCHTNYGEILFNGNCVPELVSRLERYHKESNSFPIIAQRKWEQFRYDVDMLHAELNTLSDKKPKITITIDA